MRALKKASGVRSATQHRNPNLLVLASFAWKNRSNTRDPRKENVAGDFYVDQTCIGPRYYCLLRSPRAAVDRQIEVVCFREGMPKEMAGKEVMMLQLMI